VAWMIGGFAVVLVVAYVVLRNNQEADAVTSQWVREQIRERGRRQEP
jgi:hypothetical protein